MEPISMVAIIFTSLVIFGSMAFVGSIVFGTLSYATYSFLSKRPQSKSKKTVVKQPIPTEFKEGQDGKFTHSALHNDGPSNGTAGFGRSQR